MASAITVHRDGYDDSNNFGQPSEDLSQDLESGVRWRARAAQECHGSMLPSVQALSR